MRELRRADSDGAAEPAGSVELINAGGTGPVVLACEHASNHIPDEFGGLGLVAEARSSHIAWDPGARAMGLHLSKSLDAPFVASRISRLVYDCNRKLEAADAIPALSEIYEVPGNANLSEAQREARWRLCHEPFHAKLAETILRAGRNAVLVTLHSFTPLYHGRPREVEIGILHDADSRLADAMLANSSDHTSHNVRRNEPYSATDGVTHTLQKHGIANNLLNVMLEIRNDLLKTEEQQERMARMLSGWLSAALAEVAPRVEAVQ